MRRGDQPEHPSVLPSLPSSLIIVLDSTEEDPSKLADAPWRTQVMEVAFLKEDLRSKLPHCVPGSQA